jgi:hypothetical protein
MQTKLKKLSLRFLLLLGLMGGLMFTYNNNVSAAYQPWCDPIFQSCMDGCPQGHGPCYADCYHNYMMCVLPSPLDP